MFRFTPLGRRTVRTATVGALAVAACTTLMAAVPQPSSTGRTPARCIRSWRSSRSRRRRRGCSTETVGRHQHRRDRRCGRRPDRRRWGYRRRRAPPQGPQRRLSRACPWPQPSGARFGRPFRGVCRPSGARPSGHPAQDLAVRDHEPGVLPRAPLPPCLRDRRQLGAGRVAAGHGQVRVAGVGRTVRPQAAPPGALLRCGEAPGGGGRRDLGEACPRGPRRTAFGPRPVRRRWRGRRGGTGPASRPGRVARGTRRRPRSRCRGRRRHRRAGDTRRISRRARTGSPTCWSTWWAWTTSKESSGKSRAWTSATANSTFSRPRSAATARAFTRTPSAASTAVTRPGATRAARSAVMVPGPQPTSSTSRPHGERGQQIGRRVGGGPPAVRAQDRLVVAVGVDGGLLGRGVRGRGGGMRHRSVSLGVGACSPPYAPMSNNETRVLKCGRRLS